MIPTEKKHKRIALSVSTVVTLLSLLLFSLYGFKYQDPPPPPKKMIYVELSEWDGGGGGGGNQAQVKSNQVPSASQNVQTQNVDNQPAVFTNPVQQTQTTTPAVQTPKPDPNAVFRPGMGGGSGGGTGTGVGQGRGSGIGLGDGGGTGGGVGYGTGKRKMLKIPDMTIKEEGIVYVEVHVNKDGTIRDARVISTPKYSTTITSATIRNECVTRARNTRYEPGKEELRIIEFKP